MVHGPLQSLIFLGALYIHTYIRTYTHYVFSAEREAASKSPCGLCASDRIGFYSTSSFRICTPIISVLEKKVDNVLIDSALNI